MDQETRELIIEGLRARIARHENEIVALREKMRTLQGKSAVPSASKTKTKKTQKKKRFSPEVRKRMSEAQRRRHAEKKEQPAPLSIEDQSAQQLAEGFAETLT